MNVLIVDDEQPARERLRRMFEDMQEHVVVGEAASGIEAVQQFGQTNVEVILMDIRMPGMDGLDAARHLTKLANPPAIIFTTAYQDHALEAFEAHAVGYLLKPIRREKLAERLAFAKRLSNHQLGAIRDTNAASDAREHICARVRGNLELIPVNQIYYFQADQKYVSVRHRGGEVLIEEPLKSLEAEFAPHFVRIHRNALVAREFLAGMEKGREGRHQILFKDIDDRLEVSRRHLPEVRTLLKAL